ncbi:MAG TPA: hypothetical protein VF658_03795 [Pyrinomonadaceae bacterium]|jgi:hypothetical protein
MYYFLNKPRTLCHILEDDATGEAPDPCGARASKFDLLNHQKGQPSGFLPQKPESIPLCKHCEKAIAWMRAV